MIYTLTANPAIDYNISSDGLYANTVNRTHNAVYSPNGKGLNVSFTLHHYQVPTTILGFFAGFTGQFIVSGAEAAGVPVKPVWTQGTTRVNVFLNAGPHTEYNMVNAGAAITPDDERSMLELIDSLDGLDCLVISGSLPPNTSEGFLLNVIRCVQAKGADFVLDISAQQLASLVTERPLLIKPNDDELRDIFGIEVSSNDEASVVQAMAELHARGVQNVLLTLGGDGAYFSNRNEIWFANRTFDVKLLSTVCAGDSSLAAFLSVWYTNQTAIEEALRLSMATGANVVECPGLGDFARVDEYKKGIEVRRVG
ncbi:1-phosphofructokinase [Collinsella sp. zg1085]|uniref:1-phosphofructokinase family hexose kinase n=1 Tax=Collinsella sp. zg1085 TaxID=2844380 RepID=UPI001C0D0AAB|nr:1-phosphofructokinase [Collinsella sp. zg1085]QWT18195.1 1-phosphofructokinase [Collinsella sp. zg1085]